ncbi:hypothetical protein KI387_023881, partial [Taxus chinensis]
KAIGRIVKGSSSLDKLIDGVYTMWRCMVSALEATASVSGRAFFASSSCFCAATATDKSSVQ